MSILLATSPGVDQFGAGILGLVAIFWIAIIVLALVSTIAVIWALYKILTAKNETNWKILWALIVLILGILGVILYFLVANKERKA